MRTEIRLNSDGNFRIIERIAAELVVAVMPETIANKEYVAIIECDCVNIFWADVDAKCRCMRGSVLAHDAKGSRKIGFVDLLDANVIASIWDLIHLYWEVEFVNSDKNRAIMHSRTLNSEATKFLKVSNY